jgi:hypothetical protein
MSCEIMMSGRKHQGILLDLSARGLFVQTLAVPPKEANVIALVRLRVPDPPTVVAVEAMVVRFYRVPPNLVSAAGGGLGLEVRTVPDAWPHFLATLGRKELVEATAPAPRRAIVPATQARCLKCGHGDRSLSCGLCAWCAP